jgi:hypothetical protein
VAIANKDASTSRWRLERRGQEGMVEGLGSGNAAIVPAATPAGVKRIDRREE